MTLKITAAMLNNLSVVFVYIICYWSGPISVDMVGNARVALDAIPLAEICAALALGGNLTWIVAALAIDSHQNEDHIRS